MIKERSSQPQWPPCKFQEPKGIRVPPMDHKDVWDQWGIDVHVPMGNGHNYVNNCMQQILGHKSIYINAFSISSLVGSSFCACMNAGIASLYFCAHKETPREWDTGVWDQVARLDLMHVPSENWEPRPHGTMLSTNQDASSCIFEHLPELAPLLSSATSIGSCWQTR